MTTSRHSFSSLRDIAEKLPFLHPQPTPRASREWSLDTTRRTSIGLPAPSIAGSGTAAASRKFRNGWGSRRGHRRQLGLSTFSVRGLLCLGFIVGVVVLFGLTGRTWFGDSNGIPVDDGDGVIPLGQSRMRRGREVFWWEGFEALNGFYRGWKDVVPIQNWISEQDGGLRRVDEMQQKDVRSSTNGPALVDVDMGQDFTSCYIDEEQEILPPKLLAFDGLPQGFPKPLFGSHEAVGLRGGVCYDRVNRFGPYGLGFAEEEGGLGITLEGDIEGKDSIHEVDYRNVQWEQAQQKCVASKKYTGHRTAFIIRTWHEFNYTPHHIMMLRAIISELVLKSGGKYTVHFMIHVRDDSIPIWASDDIYNQVLISSLPAEFAGMGTLWSVAQMKLIYPPPFPKSLVNFSGDEIYKAYRSLHFPLQYFAQKHPEYAYFWEWEMDIRVTGGYLELLEQVTKWSEKQENNLLWEKSAQFFTPALFQNSYSAYTESISHEVLKDGGVITKPISGPQLPESERLSIPGITNEALEENDVDLITFSPLFDPQHTRWAFHDDITGYNSTTRPPTRAALVTASRLSRRLLLTMHHETFERKHTMFPEMFPASIALHYGYKAVYAPLPVYFNRDWPATHANEIFNNAVIGDEGRSAGMDHGSGHFHGVGGSVFGPGEHVFRGATWYSNAGFAGYLWRRWLGRENSNGEIEWEAGDGAGRMCLPMMVLHPIKYE